MGLYNMLFGQSRSSTDLLALLGLTRDSFYRYRDCYLDKQGRIAVYTRGGGGNRECTCEYLKEVNVGTESEVTIPYQGVHFTECVVAIQTVNRQHPLYLSDADDDFDCTYATFYFQVPEGADVSSILQEPSRDELWREKLQALRKP